MHRAGVDGALARAAEPRRSLRLQVFVRLRFELRPAPGRAEVKEPPTVYHPMLGGRRIDPHAANRVGNQVGAVRRSSGLAVVMPGVAVVSGGLLAAH